MTVSIRHATLADVDAMATLLTQLGSARRWAKRYSPARDLSRIALNALPAR